MLEVHAVAPAFFDGLIFRGSGVRGGGAIMLVGRHNVEVVIKWRLVCCARDCEEAILG